MRRLSYRIIWSGVDLSWTHKVLKVKINESLTAIISIISRFGFVHTPLTTVLFLLACLSKAYVFVETPQSSIFPASSFKRKILISVSGAVLLSPFRCQINPQRDAWPDLDRPFVSASDLADRYVIVWSQLVHMVKLYFSGFIHHRDTNKVYETA